MTISSCQDDFPTLVAQGTAQHEGMDLVVVDEILGKNPKYFSNEVHANKNNISDAAECWTTADMLSACSFAGLDRFEYLSEMDLGQHSPAADQSFYDPARQTPCFAPPKRFFRTFWISAAKRLLDSDVTSSK